MGGCLSSSNDGGSVRGDSTDGTLGSSKTYRNFISRIFFLVKTIKSRFSILTIFTMQKLGQDLL